MAPSEPVSAMSRDDDDGDHEQPVEDDLEEAYPGPTDPGAAGAGEQGAEVAGAREARDTTPQERGDASEAGSDDGLNEPTSKGGETEQPELTEATREQEQQSTASEPASTASPDIEGRDGQPGRNDDSSHVAAPLPHEPGSPNGEGRGAEPEPEPEGTLDITPTVDESHADAATGGDLPDTPPREPDDGADPAPAEPRPPTVSPPRVTTEGSRRAGEPWRFGPRRTQRDSALGIRSDAGASPPELRIRYAGGRWEVLLSVDPKAGPSEVLQGGNPLPPARDRAWRVPDFRRDIEVKTDNAGDATIPLYTGREPLIFRLPGVDGEGTQRRRMTDRGRYVVIAPAGELRRDEIAVFREHEPCGDHRFVAHFFDSSAGREAETVEGFPEWDYGATTGSASLAGHSIFDSSDDGKLFVGDAPTLDSTGGIKWARIGEEREGGWKGRNFLVAEETPGDVLNGACGRFFLRTYRTGETHLADSRSFRYWPDLERIELNGREFDSERILIPGTEGHGKATVRLIGRVGSDLKFELMNTQGASVSTDGTIAVAPDITADELRVRLCRAPWHMDLVVALPRVWWRLQGDRSDWTSTPLSMSRREFRSIATQRLEMLVPESILFVRATLGNHQIGQFRATRTDESVQKRLCAIPLENFVDPLQDAGAREDATIRTRLNGSEVCIIHVPPERPRRALKPQSSPVPALPQEMPATPSRTEHTVLKNKVVAVGCVRVRERDKNISFTAIAIVSDGNGRVGVGHGAGRDVPEATRKGIEIATKNLVSVRRQGRTIAHEVVGAFGGVRVLMSPAPEGTGIVVRGSAREAVRAVIELAGIKDILIQSSGTSNRKKAVVAIVEGLRSLRSPEVVAESSGRDAGESLPETRR